MMPGVGAIAVVIHDGDVLLVRRGKEPSLGKWALPGGSVELGETAFAAASRELLEETGIIGQPTRQLTTLDAIGHNPDGSISYHFVLIAVQCRYVSGIPMPDDDADEAQWIKISDIASLDTTRDVAAVVALALKEDDQP